MDHKPIVYLKPRRKFIRYSSRRTLNYNRPEGILNAFMTVLSHNPDNPYQNQQKS
jgi:hypothetical protein